MVWLKNLVNIKKMKLVALLEELKDIPTHNILYHRTNINAFIRILSSGILKSNKYAFNIKNLQGKNNSQDYNEIATARKSTFSVSDIKRKHKLSYNIGSVEFQIYKDRISTLRGVKIKPIAEYGLFFERNFKTTLDNFPENVQKIIKSFIVSFFKSEKINDNTKQTKEKFLNIFLKKFLKKYPEYKDYSKSLEILKDLFNIYFDSIDLSNNREGEERIAIEKGIPLNSNYMKIKILSTFEKDFPKYYSTGEETIKKFKKDILKYDDMFIKDNNYYNFIKYIDKVIKS